MFEIITLVFIFSIFIAMVLALTLFVMRIYLVINDQRPLKEALLIVLLPGGTGYYHFYGLPSRFKRWYHRIVVVMFVLTLIGSVWIAFLNIPEFAHWFFYSL